MTHSEISFNDVLSEKVRLENSTTFLEKFLFGGGIIAFFAFCTAKQVHYGVFFQAFALFVFCWVLARKHFGIELFLLFIVCLVSRRLTSGWESYGIELLLLSYSFFLKASPFPRAGKFSTGLLVAACVAIFLLSRQYWSFFWLLALFLLFFESPWTFSFRKTNTEILVLARIIFTIISFLFFRKILEPHQFVQMARGFHFSILLLTLVYSYRVNRMQWFYLSLITLLCSLIPEIEKAALLPLSLPIFFCVLKEEVPLLFKWESLKRWNQEHNGRLLFTIFYCLLLKSAFHFYKP